MKIEAKVFIFFILIGSMVLLLKPRIEALQQLGEVSTIYGGVLGKAKENIQFEVMGIIALYFSLFLILVYLPTEFPEQPKQPTGREMISLEEEKRFSRLEKWTQEKGIKAPQKPLLSKEQKKTLKKARSSYATKP